MIWKKEVNTERPTLLADVITPVNAHCIELYFLFPISTESCFVNFYWADNVVPLYNHCQTVQWLCVCVCVCVCVYCAIHLSPTQLNQTHVPSYSMHGHLTIASHVMKRDCNTIKHTHTHTHTHTITDPLTHTQNFIHISPTNTCIWVTWSYWYLIPYGVKPSIKRRWEEKWLQEPKTTNHFIVSRQDGDVIMQF